ncbi:hypothetical protein ACFY93_14640 [Streptomyces sp. NPDC008313]|uniref:hypothetical protein n=1 Tax=Streptomyces sp. NPDC008313 TaxID=3364826 RepID=UPI0036E23A94
MTRPLLRDLAAVAAAALLVGTAVVAGRAIERDDGTLHVNWPPLYARWDPHLGPGTPAALAVAVAVVAYGPVLAARLPWRALLTAAWGTAAAWTWSLALVDGWRRGVADRLTTKYEYLQVIDRFQDIPGTLRDFTHHILIGSPGHWPAHVAGHPPGATVTFVLLDRAGLGGGAWAGAWCVTVGASAGAAVLVALRALAGEAVARRAAPFLVLAPAAVWAGTSADGYFAAVAAWALALLALAVTGRSPRTAGLASGLLFGLALYLSYGLTLIALVAGAVLLLGRARLRPLPYVAAGFAVVPAVFTLLGFDWWEAYHLLVERYYQGAGGIRPYGYWVWANPACTVLVVGVATAAGLRRAGETLVRAARTGPGSGPGSGPGPGSGAAPDGAPARSVPVAAATMTAPPGGGGAATSTAPVPGLGTVPGAAGAPSAGRAPAGGTGGRSGGAGGPVRASGPWPVRLSRLRGGLRGRPEVPDARLALLVAAALCTVLAADLSGMSKAETERIWLPFALWLLPAGAFLSAPRAWLAAQAALALLLNHLLFTGW